MSGNFNHVSTRGERLRGEIVQLMFGFRRQNCAVKSKGHRSALLHIIFVEGCDAIINCGDLCASLLSYGIEFVHLISDLSLVLFNRRDSRIRGDCRPHVRLVESDLIGDDLSLRIASAFNFNYQASEDVSNRILLAAVKKSALGLDAGIVGDPDLTIRARSITNDTRVGIAVNDYALKLHLGAARNRPESWCSC